MPKGVYKHKKLSKETKKKISLAHKGKKLSDEHKKNIKVKMDGRDVSSWIWKTHKKIRERVENGEIRYDGEYARNWQGGKCLETQKFRTLKAYREWRMKVFERDNFTCQFCGIRGGKLEAHHIRSFKEYPDLRLNLDNGVTLCVECHREFHGLNKKGNFNVN